MKRITLTELRAESVANELRRFEFEHPNEDSREAFKRGCCAGMSADPLHKFSQYHYCRHFDEGELAWLILDDHYYKWLGEHGVRDGEILPAYYREGKGYFYIAHEYEVEEVRGYRMESGVRFTKERLALEERP